GEFSAGSQGLGYIIMTAATRSDVAFAFAAILAVSILGIATFLGVAFLGNRLTSRMMKLPRVEEGAGVRAEADGRSGERTWRVGRGGSEHGTASHSPRQPDEELHLGARRRRGRLRHLAGDPRRVVRGLRGRERLRQDHAAEDDRGP